MKKPVSISRFLVLRLLMFLAAVLVAYAGAALTASQAVIQQLVKMGVPLSLADRLSMLGHDLAGLAASLLPMIALGFIIAFLVAALLYRWLRRGRPLLYALAGAAALVTIHVLMKVSFGISPVAIARSTSGLLVQGLAGAAGGWVYAYLLRRAPDKPFDTKLAEP